MVNIRKTKLLRRKSLFGKLLRFPFKFIPDVAVLPVLSGHLKGSWWIKGSHNLSILLGRYERRQSAIFVEKAKKARVFWDLGAHVGYYSLLFRSVNATGQVYAFEPYPRNAELYQRHMSLNHIKGTQLLNNAVSDHDGKLKFDGTRSSVAGRISMSGDMEVDVVRISGLVSAAVIDRPQLIKMDIEGEEAKVLGDILEILKQEKPVIFLSTHGASVHKECVEMLQGLSYRLSPIDASTIKECREILAE